MLRSSLAMLGPKLGEYGIFLVDFDGVLIRGAAPLPGAAEALRRLKQIAPVVILSNNSTCSRWQFAARMQRLGFPIRPERIVNSACVAAQHLLKGAGPSPLFLIGEGGLREELELAGHRLTGPEEARFLVAGMDRGLSYAKLSQALQALLHGARFIATNADRTFPARQGQEPGAGAIVGAISGMGFPPEQVVGKPSPIALQVALEAAGVSDPREGLLIGDRLETDILGAQRMGMDSVLVWTGVASPEDLEGGELHPTWTAESFAALVGIKLR